MAVTIENTLTIQSDAFSNEGDIPKKYTCEGENVNPRLEIPDMPEDTKALAVILEDPDAPNGPFIHWCCWDIPPYGPIEDNSKAGVQGRNGSGRNGYYGPCPPFGSHRYYFHLYALDSRLHLPAGSTKSELLHAMEGHILATGEIMARYEKHNK
jgi:Raf kinase inhibitor-like YbhB/YbcL family protein